ncbi:MAG: glycosyltransferase family 2 protein [Chromatiaceae bacterium]|nr:glycosyltransferase family 2 protein [Chromatiaceae bacterium]
MNIWKIDPNLRSLAPKSSTAGMSAGDFERPLVSLVVPAYNEAPLIESTLRTLCEYMRGLEADYSWEIVLINDGSTDGTDDIVESFARNNSNVRVFHHITNFGLGQAFKFAFRQCRGDYILTLDADLSYSADHIRDLLDKIKETRAKIVVASPYMTGGKISNVPWLRRTLSVWANRFLGATSESHLSTLTSMVRAYDSRFLRSLNLRAQGMEVLPEIIYKARLLGARIEEVPAHLDWKLLKETPQRQSSMRLWRHTTRVIVSGFLFRPVIFFILPGLLMLLFAAYVNGWMLAHFVEQFQQLTQYPTLFQRASAAIAAAYAASPHTFIVGISALMLGIQLVSLGILALQSKNYFEEVFHLASAIYRSNNEARERTRP